MHKVDLLAEFTAENGAVLLYDMHTEPFGTIRVAEQFTVADGRYPQNWIGNDLLASW